MGDRVVQFLGELRIFGQLANSAVAGVDVLYQLIRVRDSGVQVVIQ